jgi:hypothetical protein
LVHGVPNAFEAIVIIRAFRQLFRCQPGKQPRSRDSTGHQEGQETQLTWLTGLTRLIGRSLHHLPLQVRLGVHEMAKSRGYAWVTQLE